MQDQRTDSSSRRSSTDQPIHKSAGLWRCAGCGTEYTADVGTCGQNQPFECREEVVPVTETEQLGDVVAALRLALVACDGDRFWSVAEKILEQAPDTPDDNMDGVALLLRLQRAGDLEFHI